MFEDFPNLHPLVVHLPIVLILLSAGLQALLVIRDWPQVRWVALATMSGGFAGAIAASTYFHAMPMGLPPKAAAVFNTHEQYASYTLWLAGITLLLGVGALFFKTQHRAYELLVLVVALAAAGAVTVTGHHGARLVYIEGVGPQGHLVMKGEHDEKHEGQQQAMPGMNMKAGDSMQVAPSKAPKPAARQPRVPGTTYYMSSSAHWSGGGMQQPGMKGMSMPATQPMPGRKGMDMGSGSKAKSAPNQGVRPKAKPVSARMKGMDMKGMTGKGTGAKSPSQPPMKSMPGMTRKQAPARPAAKSKAMPGMGGTPATEMEAMPGMDMNGSEKRSAADNQAGQGRSMGAMPGMSMPATPAPAFLYDNNPAWEKAHPTPTTYRGKRVVYDLYVHDTLANFTGKKRWAIAVNGHIPAPTLTFTDSDTAVIRVHNRMKMETIVHWHGLLVPNAQDGVPYLTTTPIKPGTTHTFTFPLRQSGTYWYHSHTALQEQAGLYGSIVVKRPDEAPLTEKVLLLSDWTDENPHQVLRYLKKSAEWYSIRKGALQSYGEAIAAGYFKDKVQQEWKRMTPMDVADVYYDRFLINGQEKSYFQGVKPGERVKLRLINGGSSTYFTVQFAGGPMQVVAADGINIVPVTVDKIEMATAETYDVIVTVPANGAYELRATSWDIVGHGSVFLGNGPEMPAPTLPKLDYFAMLRAMNGMMSSMNMSGGGMNMGTMQNMKGMSTGGPPTAPPMPGMDMNSKPAGAPLKGMDMNSKPAAAPKPKSAPMPGMDMANDQGTMPGMFMSMNMPGMGGSGTQLSYDMLKAIHPTTLDSTNKVREVKLTLTGNMLRYVWSFDNKTLSEADVIPIRRGENVRFVLTNTTMMRHPMHLHGHFFRFVTAQGRYSPMLHTFDIKPMETVTIEFLADEDKAWFFHCHNLYHMMSGMARIVSYEDGPKNEFAKTGYRGLTREDNVLYPWADVAVHSQGAFGQFNLSNNKNALEIDARASRRGDVEVENHLLRYLDKRQYLAAFVGFDYRNDKLLLQEGVRNLNGKYDRRVFDAGFYYLLPMLVRSEFRVDDNGRFRLQLERRDLALSNNFFADLVVNTDLEYTIGFRYQFSRYFSASTNYDSDYKWGAGLTFHY
ncbi:multicopper oxidase domain-containing protein [Hymenobacter sp. UV11]|uniref:multicopper oxidase domain-containing protein n=1 Tax=Hymenobacter sp. UV11 TaxID=1849735 RepID=UPI001414E0C7|nr:multicopper oxidase domain-containing protein [Hymenobacter sp. UV11]